MNDLKNDDKDPSEKLDELLDEAKDEMSKEELEHFKKIISFIKNDTLKESKGKKFKNFILSFFRNLIIYILTYFALFGIFKNSYSLNYKFLIFILPVVISFILALTKAILRLIFKNSPKSIEIYGVLLVLYMVTFDIIFTKVNFIHIRHYAIYLMFIIAEVIYSVINYYFVKFKINHIVR